MLFTRRFISSKKSPFTLNGHSVHFISAHRIRKNVLERMWIMRRYRVPFFWGQPSICKFSLKIALQFFRMKPFHSQIAHQFTSSMKLSKKMLIKVRWYASRHLEVQVDRYCSYSSDQFRSSPPRYTRIHRTTEPHRYHKHQSTRQSTMDSHTISSRVSLARSALPKGLVPVGVSTTVAFKQ